MRVCIVATVLAYLGKAWIVDKGPCISDSLGCVMTPNFPKNYSNGESCQMSGSPGCSIGVQDFHTESNADFLCVEEACYSGSAIPSNVVPNRFFTWRTDGTRTDSGWRLCPTGPGCTVSDKENAARTSRSTLVHRAMSDLQSSMHHDMSRVVSKDMEMLKMTWIFGLVLCVCVAVLALATALWLPRNTPRLINSTQVPLLGESQHGSATKEAAVPFQTKDTCAASAEEDMVLQHQQARQLEEAAVPFQTKDTCAASAEEDMVLQHKQAGQLEARLASLEQEVSRLTVLVSSLQGGSSLSGQLSQPNDRSFHLSCDDFGGTSMV